MRIEIQRNEENFKLPKKKLKIKARKKNLRQLKPRKYSLIFCIS